MLKRNSRTPLYIQLAELFREKILSGEIKVGDKLPSESQMIKEYSLGRLTVREALSVLANDGLIEKHHGKGTFCKACPVLPKYRVDVILNLSDAYFVHHYLQAICTELEDNDVSVILHDTKNSSSTIEHCLEKILTEGTDGVIFQPSSEGGLASEGIKNLLCKYKQFNIPYIMLDCIYDGVDESYVIMNETESGTIAANYFKSLGHTELCMITKEENIDSRLRLDGFKNALGYMPYIIEHSDKLSDSVSEMLKQNKDISGFFCYNDSVAKDLYRALSKKNLRVPDDISIVSVDDTVIASALRLTSVVHQKKHLAKTAARAIVNIINKKEEWPFKKIFEPSLNIRKSCKPI